ncbi:MAG: hypothetical protein ACE5HI_10305 [bacterium]
MNTCKNHSSMTTTFRCCICGSPICLDCFDAHLLYLDRKKIGFCSEECVEEFEEKRAEFREANRKKSYRFLIKNMRLR